MGIQAVVDPILAGLATAAPAAAEAGAVAAPIAADAAAAAPIAADIGAVALPVANAAAPLAAGLDAASALAPVAGGVGALAPAAAGAAGALAPVANAAPAVAGLAPTAATTAAAAAPAAAPALSAVTGAAPAGVASALPATTAAADTTGITGAATSQLPGTVGAGAAGGGASNLAPISLSTPSPLVTPPASEALSAPVSGISTDASPSLVDKGLAGAKNVGSSIIHGVEKHPLTALEGGLFAASALRGMQQPPGYGALQGSAQALGQQGEQLERYLSSGTLPPGMQASITAAGDAAEATIRSQYAQRGMSGSSAEAQDIQNARERSAAQGQELALQLFQQGLNETELSDQLYSQLMQVQMQQDAQLMQGITGFSTSLAGLGRAPGATAG